MFRISYEILNFVVVLETLVLFSILLYVPSEDPEVVGCRGSGVIINTVSAPVHVLMLQKKCLYYKLYKKIYLYMEVKQHLFIVRLLRV